MSGFAFGMVLMALFVTEAVEEPLPTNVVIWLLFGVMFAVAILVSGVHSALSTKET